jgi:hypothetical protein
VRRERERGTEKANIWGKKKDKKKWEGGGYVGGGEKMERKKKWREGKIEREKLN